MTTETQDIQRIGSTNATNEYLSVVRSLNTLAAYLDVASLIGSENIDIEIALHVAKQILRSLEHIKAAK